MRTLAVLPVKRFDLAKTRLSEMLGAEQRRRLAEAMAGDVLDALIASSEVESVLVVTSEPAVARLARTAGAGVLPDPGEVDHTTAARAGIAHALAGGWDRVLLVPGDCPALDAPTLRELLGGDGDAPAVTIVADRHGSGTNALVLRPPNVIEPGFGPGSFERHRERARAAGASWRSDALPALLLDVDTPEDLAALRDALPTHAARTRAVLEAL